MRRVIDEIGNRYGKLVVIELAPSQNRNTMVLCQCDCGNTAIVRASNLRQGITKSCGCMAHKPEGIAAFNQIYNSMRNNARSRGYKFNLTKEQVMGITQENCTYCGTAPYQITKDPRYNGQFTYNGIDRVDNTKGYTIDNVVPCCGRCNRAKDIHDIENFRQWVTDIYHNWASGANIHDN